ncbi:bifunctional phosphoribosylaminoimidazolecarboxamide formyltransferase/IMP cyclohydrolase [Streptococcus pluranimalium]|uniref:bifunctional phosphoribosylaminoimidazolecarboxamide formyltransferase/IMP cyclohydrolase n=1 Tax=Streptococcus pluranimalium TaxID=82348 RepID=UPI003F68FC8D
MTKCALISVSDKAGIVEFAQELTSLGWEIISTGGTKTALDAAGITTIAIDDVTGFPEMMDGRVKTLHPNIHGGLLARRDLDSHLDAAKDNNIELIDMVVVNLYPFKETILRPDVTYDLAVENIDIGGPSMLRSAAKNHASVTVVVDPADYATVLEEFKAAGDTSYETRQALAAKVFRHTAAYDALIAEYFTAQVGEEKPEKLTLTYDLKQALRYGENPQQDADFYQKAIPTDYSIASAKQLNGKELSFNNIRDADAAIRIIRDFKDRPTVVALKHMNPCGIGQADDIETAWDYAYEADSVSIFGGIVVLNREVDAATAEKMHPIFLEIIIAPSYSDEALAILTNKKKNLRILELPFDAQDQSEVEAEYTGVVGGLLVQNQDVVEEKTADWQVVTDRQPSEQEVTALEFAWKAIKYVKSNGILIANDHMTLGVGPGQTNRVASVRIAIEQAKDRLDGAVLASDAFFPFADNIEEIAAAGIKAIIQPGGSVRDQESINVANKYGITMVFTGVRHFRH